MIVAITGRMAMKKIIDVTHVSARGTSYRITIPIRPNELCRAGN